MRVRPQITIHADSSTGRRRSASGGSAVVSAPAVGEPLTMRWRLPPGDEPLAHRELEALAALAGHLRERGLVLCARPQVRLTYGRAATITVSCRVRPAGARRPASSGASSS